MLHPPYASIGIFLYQSLNLRLSLNKQQSPCCKHNPLTILNRNIDPNLPALGFPLNPRPAKYDTRRGEHFLVLHSHLTSNDTRPEYQESGLPSYLVDQGSNETTVAEAGIPIYA